MKKGLLNFTIPIVSALILLCACLCHAAFLKTIEKKNAALIQKACKASEDYDLCLSVLKGDPRSATATVEGLTIIVLEHTITKAQETIDLVNKLGANTTDKPLKICFKGCAEEYQQYIGHCQIAISDVRQNIFDDAEASIDYAAENESSCEYCFSETIPPRKSPITSENQLNNRLLGIAANIYALTRK